MAKPFISIFKYFVTHKTIFWGVFIVSSILTGYFAFQIKPVEDISKILPNDKQSKKLNDIIQSARFADKLVLIVSLQDSNQVSPDLLSSFSDSISSRLRRLYPGYIDEIANPANDSLYPELIQLVLDHIPIFLEPEDYQRIDSLRDLSKIKEKLKGDFHTLSSPAGFVVKSLIERDPLGFSDVAFKKIRRLQYDENFELYNGHIISKDNRYMLLFIRPVYPADNTGRNSELLGGIDHIIYDLQQEKFQVVHAEYFGSIAVAAGNAKQLKYDSYLTLGLVAVFLILFIAWYFKRKTAPLLILVPVIQGALFSLCVLYWIKGSISVIALAAGSIVLGIAINYSLHVYNHFRHRRNMQEVIQDLSFPLTIGGFTTIGGFLCLQFVQSEILKDLGIFAAFTLIGASLSSLIFLPQLILALPAGYQKSEVKDKDSWIVKLADFHPENKNWIVGIIFILTIFFSFYIKRVGFDQDMMHMNYMPDNLKKSESTLNKLNAYSLRSVFLITDGNSLNDALNRQQIVNQKIKRLVDNGYIKKYSGVFDLLISDSVQRERSSIWNQYWTKQKQADLLDHLRKTGDSLGFTSSAFVPFESMLKTPATILDSSETIFLKTGFANEFILRTNNRVSLITLLKVQPEDRDMIYKTFAGISDVTAVDKQLLTTKLLSLVSVDFSRIGWMVSILVFIVLLITYGRIELTLISFIPMIIAFIWILGIMGLAGLEFNIVNIILSALIFGLGDDYSLFIMEGLLQEYRTGKKNLSSYKSSIVLSAITTLAGLGVLIFAKHPALRSIALISITGILSVVVVAQVLIPFLFNFFIQNRVNKGLFPWTITGLFKSIFSLSYFALGSLMVTAIGYVFVKWNPIARKTTKYLYHRILSAYTWSVLYIMTNVKKKIINPNNEDFSHPVVLIANHQSFLDILILTLLHPKVILLTNNWVWNSPVFGRLVRIAGYYPVSRGIENSIDYLSVLVKAGYSIAVFPEGTRSSDQEIKRFHKGAFYIAEKLQLDLLPLIIHGSGYTMSKGDFLLKDGYITMQFMPRIAATKDQQHSDYSEQSKQVGRYFRKEYEHLRLTSESTRFFREQLIYNYIYKGPVLEWYVRIKTRMENNYQLFDELLPKQGHILDIGCGYGLMSYMLHFTSKARRITGYDFDTDKIDVASHCFSRDEKIRFVEADVTGISIETADGIILSDVLHYLDQEHQEKLIKKCMLALNPNGILVIRDGDKNLRERHFGTRITEYFSTRIFAFNKTSDKQLHYLSGDFIQSIAASNNMICRTIDQTHYTSNLIFVITHSQSQ
jgi:uncharacterized protein